MLSNDPFLLPGSTYQDQACLFLHGLGGGIYEMRLLADYLHQLGFTVQGSNYPGHDRPALVMPSSTWQQWYGQVLATYQQLIETYAQITLVCFSTGCPLGLYLASQYPVHKLILLSPFFAIKHQWFYGFRPEQYLKTMGNWIDHAPRLQLAIRDAAMRRTAEQIWHYRTFNLVAVRSALELIELVKPRLAQVTAPTLILQSTHDSVVDPAGAEFAFQALGSSVKYLQWLTNSDHILCLDRQRQTVFTCIGAFLQDQAPEESDSRDESGAIPG
jgi:carboxylesterase